MIEVGETILDGVIPLVEIAHDVSLGTWAFPLLSNEGDFWGRLDAVRLDDLSQATFDALAAVSLHYYYPHGYHYAGVAATRWFHSALGDFPPAPRTLPWYDLLSLCEAVIEEAEGCQLVGSLPSPTLSVTYLDSDDAPRTITRTFRPHVFSRAAYRGGALARDNSTLPAWTGKEWLEHVLGLFGWRLRVRYDAYPSTNILVEVLPDDRPEPDPSTRPALDERQAQGGYTRRAEPAKEGGVAIRHANSLRQTSLSLRMPRRYRDLEQKGHGTIPVPPPTAAALAMDRWAFKAPRPGARGEPEPAAETIYDTGFRLPYLGHPTNEGLQLAAESITPDVGEHPDYEEALLYGLPVLDSDLSAVYLASIVEVGGAPYLLYAREVADPVPGQPWLVNEVWAGELYKLRSLSTQRQELADGDFYVHGLELEVGVPALGAALEGRSWLLRERRVDLKDDRARLVLARPAGEAARPEAPRLVGEVQDLEARYEISFDGNDVDRRLLILTWTPPPVEQANFLCYDVQWREKGAPIWTHAVIAYATAHIIEVEHNKTYEYGVRAVGDGNALGGNRLGEWARGEITTNNDAVAN